MKKNDEKKYHRKDLVVEQLKTAVCLFLNNADLSSVITLAGAAANILTQLVRNAGKEPFIDYACKVHNHLKGITPPRQKYNHYIDKFLGISAHKHMSDSCPATITLDLRQCAIYSLTRAIGDYEQLYGHSDAFVKAFLSWRWENEGMTQSKFMQIYKQIPEKLKRKVSKNEQKNIQAF